MIDDEEMSYTISSSNVFADAGLPNPDECLARAKLLSYIVTEIDRRGLSHNQAQAARLLGIPQSHIRLLLRAHLSSFSLENLLQMVKKLGMQVAISCEQTTGEEGHLTISLPQSA